MRVGNCKLDLGSAAGRKASAGVKNREAGGDFPGRRKPTESD